VDDYSKFSWIYLLKFKSEVNQKFHEFQALVERMFDRKIGIAHQVSCPHAHQQNG
jgi:hypothetical protein